MDSQNSPSAPLPPGAYLLEGTRTPGLNSASRARAGFSALDLAVQCANALLLRCGLAANALDGVVLATGASQAADKVRLRLQLSPEKSKKKEQKKVIREKKKKEEQG